MGLLLIFVGLAMMSAAARGDPEKLADLVAGDFTGDKNFLAWSLALVTVGLLGYFEPIKPLSRMFMALLIVSIIVSNKGLFETLNKEFRATGAADNVITGVDFQKGK